MKMIKFFLFVCLFYANISFAYITGGDRYKLNMGVSVPFQLAMQAQYNWSPQYYSSLGAGFALEKFLTLYHSTLEEFNFLTPGYTLFTNAIGNAVVFNARIGWAPNIFEGPFIDIGYNMMIFGKSMVKGNLINAFMSNRTGDDALPETDLFRLNNLNHGPALHIGYRFIIVDKLSVDMEFSFYKPLFSHTSIDYGENFTVATSEVDSFNAFVYKKVWFASVGIWLGLFF